MKHLFTLFLAAWALLTGCTTPVTSPDTPAPTTAPTPTPAVTISGFVFRDLNANGIRDLREPGEPDITVSIYDANDHLVATTATDTNGDYTITSDLDSDKIVGDQDYVVIFSGWPDYLTPGPHGEDSGTEVQFVVGGAANVNFGLFNPDQYVAPKQTAEPGAAN